MPRTVASAPCSSTVTDRSDNRSPNPLSDGSGGPARAGDGGITGGRITAGGIFDADHALEYLLAGASAVQIGSANLVNLNAPWRILSELKKRLAERGVSDLARLGGAAWTAPIA